MSESKSDALTNLATPLHRTRLAPRPSKPVSVGPAQQRVVVQTAAHPSQPSAGRQFAAGHVATGWSSVPTLANTALPEPVMRLLPKRACSQLGDLRALRGTAPSATGCRSLRPKPAAKPLGQAAAASRKRAREYNSFGVAGQRRAAEDVRGGDGRGRLDHREALRRQGQRRQPLADAFDEGVVAADEEGHVGAQRCRPSASSRCARPVQAPQPVQRQQRAGGVGTAAAQAGAPGHLLVDRDVGAAARMPLAAAAARAARRHRSSAGSAGPRSWRASAAVAAALEVQACRTSRSARTPTAAGGSRRRAGRPRAGTGSAWPAPARRSSARRLMARSAGPAGARTACTARRGAAPARTTSSRRLEARQVDGPAQLHEAGPGCSGCAGRPRRPGPAAQPVGQRAPAAGFRPSASRDSASRSSKRRSPCGVTSTRLARAPSAPRPARAQRRAQAQFAALGRCRAGRSRRSSDCAGRVLGVASTCTRQAAGESRRRAAARRQRGAAAPAAPAPPAALARAAGSSHVDLQPGQGFAQHVVGGVAAAGFAPDAARFVALARGPQHLAQVGADLGVGPRRVGLAQQAQRLVAVAQAELDPAQAVGDEGVAGRQLQRAFGSAACASGRRRLRSASE